MSRTVQSSMVKLARLTVATALLTTWSIGATHAADRLGLEMTSSELTTVSRIDVSGDGGHYNRVETPNLDIALNLSAKFLSDEANIKIIRAELFLKSDGQLDAHGATSTFDGTAPVRSLATNKSFKLSFQNQGPVAQAAIAACNAMPVTERSLKTPKTVTFNTPVLWRVTTGKFNFKWTSYDHVAPSADIINNPDVYAARETQDAEVLVTATAACAPLTTLPAIASKQAPIKAAPKLEAKLATVKTPIVQPALVKTAVLEQPAKTTCTGGMLREIANDTAMCLCPGNTRRIEQGPETFSCVRKSARR